MIVHVLVFIGHAKLKKIRKYGDCKSDNYPSETN